MSAAAPSGGSLEPLRRAAPDAVKDRPDQLGERIVDQVAGRVWVEVDGVELSDSTSWSALRGFEYCPTQWALGQHVPKEFKPGPAGLIGIAVHSILAGLRRSNDLRDLWLDAGLAMPEVIPYHDRVMDIVRNTMRWDPAMAAIERSVAAERTVEGVVAGVQVRGRLDLVEGDQAGPVVSDWKVRWDVPDRSDLGVDGWQQRTDMRQVVLYSSLLDSEEFGVPSGVRIYEVAGQSVSALDLRSGSGLHAKREAEQFVVVNRGRMEDAAVDGVFEAHATPRRCAGCEFRQVCPASLAPTEVSLDGPVEVPVELSAKAS